MNLIDRFIDFNDWPTCQKTALLMAVALPFQALLSLVAGHYAHASGIVDAQQVDVILYSGVAVVASCLAGALITSRLNYEGRWTAHIIIHVYGGWLFWLYAGVGVWSSPLIAASPMLVLLLTLWYDERIGWAGLAHFTAALGALIWLTYTDVVPYAYLMKDRGLNAHLNPAWPVAIVPAFMGFFIFAFCLSLLTLAARRQQGARLTQAQALIRRYLPTHLADRIESGEHEAQARPKRQKLTIFFSDLVGFTQASDELDPEELADVLDEYLSEMAEIAEKHGASINQMAGDGIMLLFGAPIVTHDRDHALRAVRMAVAMQQRLSELKSRWLRHGLHAPLEARMGINTGYVSVGDFGSVGRKIYTAIGMQVNVAARIQAMCQPGKVLVSESTWALVRGDIACDARGELELKGVHYPVPIYQVHDPDESPAMHGKVTAIRARN